MAEKEVDIIFPEFGENLAGFTIRDFGSSKSGLWGGRTYRQWYILDTFETGNFTIPAAIVKFKDSVSGEWKGAAANKIDIEVKSLLDKDADNADIRDIKGPVSTNRLIYIYIALAVLAAALLLTALFLILKKRRRIPDEASPPLLPAHEIAYEALGVLKKKDYLSTGDIRKYYYELSGIVRRYIENRFGIRAPEMTTEEFLSGLRNSDKLDSGQKTLIRGFLSQCDMVKFAKHLPGNSEINISYESAKDLIDQTKEITDKVKQG